MEEKTVTICSSCGQEITAAGKEYEGRLYCTNCQPARAGEETIAVTGDDLGKTRAAATTIAGDEQTVVLEKTVLEEKTTGAEPAAPGSTRVLTLGRSVPATRIIREVLKIEPSVDLEHSSQIYYSLKGESSAQESSSSVRQLISHAGEETKYIFDRELGRGGMGAVFETVDLDVRRKVAMKVMLPAAKKSSSQVKRFLEEAQITGQLEHPNIVPVHEIGIDDEHTTYFTMKLVRGENLDAIIAHLAAGDQDYQKKYSLGALIQIFMKICDGIGYAHAKGVLHRDLKPENIMIGDFGEVMVMDWGLAKVLGQESVEAAPAAGAQTSETASVYQTMEGQVMGTPSYMSPEQAAGRISELDQRSDIFSLGGILYKILTHQAPYQGKTTREILEKARKRQLVPPDVREPQQAVSPEVNAICMKAMARNPEERYATTLELKNDLQLFLDGKSVSAKKDSLLVRTKKWVIRNKVLSMGIAAAVVCLIAGIAVTSLYEQTKRRNTIAGFLSDADQAQQSGQFEKAEEIFFSVLGLDNNNEQARRGIALVSGKALAVKNKRLAKDKLKEAQALFAGGDYIKAYDAYVATFALDPDSADARQGIQGAAVKADRQKAQEKIKPLLAAARGLENEKSDVEKSLVQFKAESKKLKSRIKGYEDAGAKKPLWDAEKTVLAKQMDKLKLEGRIISAYSTVLSYDGETPEARKALATIYYNKFTEAEALQNKDEMAYFKELLLSFDDGSYKTQLEREGVVTLTTNPPADAYFIYRFIDGPDQRVIPAPFSPAAYFSSAADTSADAITRGIDPGYKLSAAAFLPYEKLLRSGDFNRLSQIDKLKMPTGSYLVLITKKGYMTTRLPLVVGRGDSKLIENIALIRTTDVPAGFAYVPAGEFIMGGDSRAPYSLERSTKFVPGFLMAQHEVTAGEYLKFINFIEERLPGSAEKYVPRKSATAGFYWKKTGGQYHSDFPADWPVLGISWNDAKAYCRWMTLQNQGQGWEFRLPEDWEWEKAARGVDGRYYPWGNNFDYRFCSMAYSREGKRDGPDPVGSFPLDESVYGVRDIAGNVAEWCETFFDAEQNIRINKGAAWSYVDDDYARCAERNGHSPADVADFRGFRMVLSRKR